MRWLEDRDRSPLAQRVSQKRYTALRMIYALTIGFVIAVWLAIVVLNEKKNLLSCDRFP